jgi:hypothetical protein
MVDYELAKFQFGPGAKGFARITQDRCPALPESCSISLRRCHNAGGGSPRPAETALMS